MRVEIEQTIINRFSAERELINSATFEVTVLCPEDGKWLKNIKTGAIYQGRTGLKPFDSQKNYIEIDAPEN